MAVTPTGPQFGPSRYECNLLYLACLAALVLGGSGPMSIDGYIAKRQGAARRELQGRAVPGIYGG